MSNNDWTSKLYEKLADYETQAPEGLWEEIENRLARPSKSQRKAKTVAIRRWATAAAVTVLLAGGGYTIWHGQEKEDTNDLNSTPIYNNARVEKLPNENTNQEVITIQTTLNGGIAAITTGSTTEKNKQFAEKEKQAVDTDVQIAGNEIQIAGNEIQIARNEEQRARNEVKELGEGVNDLGEDVQNAGKEAQKIDEKGGKTEKTIKEKNTIPSLKKDYALPSKAPKGQERAEKLEIRLYAMNGLSDENSQNGVRMSQQLLDKYSYANSIQGTLSARSRTGAYLTDYKETARHHQPLALGLSVTYPIWEKIEVSTGLVYTKLESDFTTLMGRSSTLRQQELYYIGIPLAVKYNLWQWKGLNIYASANSEIDININADTTSDGVSQEMGKDKPQYSVGAAFGLEYNILPQLGIYAEPGIRRYIDNGSKIQNYFKDKPTTTSLQIGLRLNVTR